MMQKNEWIGVTDSGRPAGPFKIIGEYIWDKVQRMRKEKRSLMSGLKNRTVKPFRTDIQLDYDREKQRKYYKNKLKGTKNNGRHNPL